MSSSQKAPRPEKGALMKKIALMILVGTAVATLLVIAATSKLHEAAHQPDPFVAVSWLTAILALAVFVVMFAEYFIHGRRVHLHLGGAFLAIGLMGVWDALTFPYDAAFGVSDIASTPERWAYLLTWQVQLVTLAVVLIYAMARGRKFNSKDQVIGRAVTTSIIGILWSAITIFIITNFLFDAATNGEWIQKACMIASGACAAAYAVSIVGYGRRSIHRNDAVLSWMAYGLIFGMLAQLAMAVSSDPSKALFWFAAIMKILMVAAPLAGMLAGYTRLQIKLRDQAYDMSYIVQCQQAVTTIVNPTELYRRLSEIACTAFQAKAACLMPFEKDRGLLRVAAHVGLDDELVKRLTFRSGEGPAGDSLSDKQIVVVPDILEDTTLNQKLEGHSDMTTGIFAPLVNRDECLGVLALFFAGRPMHKLSKEKARLLDAIATQAAIAVDGAEMRERLLGSSRTTGGYAQELETVWEIGRAVGSEVDLNAFVDALADKLRAAFGASTCSVLVFEPDLIGVKILGQKRLTRYQSVAEHIDQCDAVAAMVARKGEPLILNDVPNSCHCKYPELACEDGGVHHMLCVPMSLRGFTGAVSVFRHNGEPFGEAEKRLLTRLSPVVAAGIRNAELYERESLISRNLQESLRSKAEQDYAGIAVSGGYQAAFDESLVGGDFYDVIDFGSGKYGVAIGDVSGKGPEAAVYTGMARYMIQAYSADDIDPVYVVSKLNTALCRYTPDGKFITLVYGIVDTKAKTLTYVNAGHETPFIYRAETGKLENLASTGPAAGAVEEGDYASDTTRFMPGDTLILYTDGATEARQDGRFLGTEGLEKILKDLVPKHPDDLPEALIKSVKTYAKGRLRDDIAVLTVTSRVPGALF